MAKTKISEFDVDPANNTDINSINIAEGCAPSGINNAIRQLMSDLKAFQTGADGDPFNGAVNGTVGATTPASGAFTSLSASGAFSANGGATLGDASGDALTINSSAVSIPNGLNFDSNTLVIDATNNRVGINFASPASSLYVLGDTVLRLDGSGTTTPLILRNNNTASIQAIKIGFDSSGAIKSSINAAVYGNDYMTFNVGSDTERMRITSGGSVGVGTSSPAATNKFQVSQTSTTDGATAIVASCTGVTTGTNYGLYSSVSGATVRNWGLYVQAGDAYVAGNVGIGTSSPSYKLDVAGLVSSQDAYLITANSSGTPSAGAFMYRPASNTIALGTNSTERLRIDSSGNLGLGVTPSAWSASYKALQFGSTGTLYSSNSAAIANNFYADSGGTSRYITTAGSTVYLQNGSQHAWYNAPSGTAGNAITFTQAMTLNASGQWLLNTTSPIYSNADAAHIYARTSGGNQFGLMIGGDASAYTCTALRFLTNNSGNVVGSVTFTTSATAYNTSSDYRLKNVTGKLTNSGSYIDKLNPVEGTWKADGSVFVGLIAHEVQEVSRTQVATGVKDGEEMQAMDYSNSELIANLIAEVQSLRKRVATLEAK